MFTRFLLALVCAGSAAHAHTKSQITQMSELRNFVQDGRAEDTLYVFDIDNTLLRTKIDLGGDAWFAWQEGLLKNNPASPDLVAKDFAGLINVEGWMYTLGQMIPVESTTPQLFKELQDEGHPVILLTSRGADFENLTNTALAVNGYRPVRAAIAPRNGFAAAFLPYDLKNPARACLTADDVQRLAIPEAKPVVYRNGIMLTGGQNKGVMLRTLLCKLRKSYKHIFFVDDQQRHVDRVFAAFENQAGDVTALQYAQMDAEVKAFLDSDKSEVRAQWEKLKAVFAEIFR